MPTTVVHKREPHDVYIGRPSKFGNPFVIGRDGSREDVIRKYAAWIKGRPDLIAAAKQELKGKRIACWCAPQRCHGNVLALIADME